MAKRIFTDEQWDKFTDELKNVFNFIEHTLTHEHPALCINENYFLLAIFRERECLASKIIDALLSDTAYTLIKNAYQKIVINSQLTAIKPNREIPYDEKFKELINEAIKEMTNVSDERLSSIHVVLAIINPTNKHSYAQKIMKGGGLSYQLLRDRLASLKGETSDSVETFERKTTETPKPSAPKKRPVTWEFDLMGVPMKASTGQFLTTYCVNLNKKAKDGKIDPVIGRDREIERIGKVFNRRRQNNVVVVGDKGSGKTVLCESLAWLIANNQAPYSLQDKTIFKLDISAMIAGTTYRGMFEERAKGVFNELQKQPNCILFIDDFHLHTTKRDNESSTDITPFLKEAIGDGSIKVITTCTQKGYHRKFDSDSSLASNFQRVDLDILSDKEVKVVLMEVKGIYEKYHNITINEQIIDLCIKLCKKYVTDRDMPDSVIDLIDEIGANLSDKYQEPQFEKDYVKEREKLLKDKDKAIKDNDFALIDEIADKLAVSHKQHIAKSKKHTANNVVVKEEDVYNILSQKTNIPIQNLSDDDKKDLSAITDRLKQVVIGQDEAIDKICKVIKRKKLGLHTGRGTAIFLQGKTGCGKCVIGETTIKVRNKKTGIVETIAIEDFYKRLK